MSAARLYTPEVLAAAVGLAEFPLTGDMPLLAEARSPSCGSTIRMGLEMDGEGRISKIGIAASACAIGQASALLFARGAKGSNAEEIALLRDAMRNWLSGEGDAPDWPGIELIAPARELPARHGAIMLPWDAAHRAMG